MKEVFALQGIGNSGKTDTIKKVYSELLNKYPHANVQILSKRSIDIKAIISNVNGYKVGIESQGDPCSRLQASLQDFENSNCDIIICATRTSGMTVNWVNELSETYKINFIPQQISSQQNQQRDNLAMARNIIKKAKL